MAWAKVSLPAADSGIAGVPPWRDSKPSDAVYGSHNIEALLLNLQPLYNNRRMISCLAASLRTYAAVNVCKFNSVINIGASFDK